MFVCVDVCILSLSSGSCCLHPNGLTLVPPTGHLLLVYSDWIAAALRGCKSGKLLKQSVLSLEAHLCCGETNAASASWDLLELISSSHRLTFQYCADVFVCMHETISPGASQNNSHSPLWYILIIYASIKISPYWCLLLANSFEKLSTKLQQINLWC